MESPREPAVNSFDDFLTLLSPDREEAGALYEDLRIRLVRFFKLRGIHECENAADETLDRIIAKCGDGVVIEDYLRFAFGVAWVITNEMYRRNAVITVDINDVKEMHADLGQSDDTDDDVLLSRLRECLAALEEVNRKLVLEYYGIDNRRIAEREALAGKNNMNLNSLRLKVFRLKKRIGRCLSEKKITSR